MRQGCIPLYHDADTFKTGLRPVNPMTQSFTEQQPEVFARDAEPLLERVQGGLRAVIDALPASERPADVVHALGLHRKLAWQVFRAARAASPLEAAAYVPSHASIKRIAAAAERLGIPGDALLAASEELHAFAARHAADRRTFDAMVASLAGAGASPVEGDLKRAAYRAMSQICGVHAERMLHCYIVGLGDGPGRLRLTESKFIEGLRRTRADAPLVIARRLLTTDGAGAAPADPRTVHDDVPVVCLDERRSVVPTKNVPAAGGFIETQLASTAMGLNASFSCILAEDVAEVALAKDDTGELWLDVNTAFRTPCRAFVRDVLIHEDLFGGDLPQCVVKASPEQSREWPRPGSSDLLPIQETVARLRTPPVLHVPGVPGYRDAIADAFHRLGWDDMHRFRHFRCTVDYPIFNSLLWLRFDCREWLGRQPG